MAFNKKKTKEKIEEVIETKEVEASAADFTVKSASTGSVDVSKVTGAGQVGVSTSYSASAELVITEVSALVTNISAINLAASFGQDISITWDDPGTLFTGTSGIDFTVVQTVADNAVAGTLVSANAQVTVDDDGLGETTLTSATFELSATGNARNEAFAPDSPEWRARMIDEGLI